MAPPAAVAELVQRFDSHRDAYRSGHYNEAQLREEFLNPFCEALGWDVYNEGSTNSGTAVSPAVTNWHDCRRRQENAYEQ